MIIEGVEIQDKTTSFTATFQSPKTGEIYRRVRIGYPFTLCGTTWYLHRHEDGEWLITEATTGTYAAKGRTRSTAIKDLQDALGRLRMNERKLARYVRLSEQAIKDMEHGNTGNGHIQKRTQAGR